MKIRLVKDGIFPIIRNQKGNLLKEGTKTGYPMSGTIQGEGKLAGIPSLFVRTAGCNLRCTWADDKGKADICDTPYSSHHVTEFEEWDISDILKVLEYNRSNMNHVIISGGEPTLQAPGLTALASAIRKKLNMHITLETNGTNYIPELASYINLFSISPKLSSSEPSKTKNTSLLHPVDEVFIHNHARLRKNIDAIQKYINSCMILESYYGDKLDTTPVKRKDRDFQLKFVVAREDDEKEIREDFLSRLGFVNNEDVLVMPLGSDADKLKEHIDLAAKIAIRNGWRFSPRIQIDVFGDTAGT